MTYPTVVEIVGRSTQGMTRPFICRADDDEVYFVKGRHAGTRSLVCEWLAGSLAKAFGLPIAPFTLLRVPSELVEMKHAAGEPLDDLGSGFVFGSCRRELSELTMSTAEKVPDEVRADIAVFDWWVRNEDRTLTEHGGNPNLFWDAAEARIWVVDHNLAFDKDFNTERFLDTHVFADDLRVAASNFVTRTSYALRLSDALSAWPEAVASIPELWQYIDPEQTIPLGFEFDDVYSQLNYCKLDQFWNLDSQ